MNITHTKMQLPIRDLWIKSRLSLKVIIKNQVFSFLINKFSLNCCCCRGDDLPKMGLLMVVLSLIFMSDHVITECKCINLFSQKTISLCLSGPGCSKAG